MCEKRSNHGRENNRHLLGKLLRKKPLRIRTGIWEDDIKMDFKENDSGIVVWVHLV